MITKAKNGEEYYLVDVIAQILKYLKNELIENLLQNAGRSLEATDFDWVITVPAIWRARGKQMMREAGYKVPNNSILSLCLVCLLLFCLLQFRLLLFRLLNIFTSIFSSKSYPSQI